MQVRHRDQRQLVSWSAAANADGYLVQWTTTGQSFDNIRQASVAGTSHTITGLAYSTEYFVRVVATRTGAANNGPPSDPPATATTNAPPVPAQVSGVQASARSDTAISVSWSAAANADGYLVQWTTAGQSFDAARQASVAGTTHTITGLAYSTDYRVQVTATRTGAVNGPPSQPANARTNPLSPPQQVSGVQASARSDTAISVSWPSAANADGYLVQWAATGQSFDTARQASVTGTSRTRLAGLTPTQLTGCKSQPRAPARSTARRLNLPPLGLTRRRRRRRYPVFRRRPCQTPRSASVGLRRQTRPLMWSSGGQTAKATPPTGGRSWREPR